MRMLHAGADLLHQWKNDQCSNSVRDERRDHEDQ